MLVTHSSSLDKLLDLVPDLIEKTTKMLDKKLNKTKTVQENVIVKVSDENKNKEKENNEPSKTVKVEITIEIYMWKKIKVIRNTNI